MNHWGGLDPVGRLELSRIIKEEAQRGVSIGYSFVINTTSGFKSIQASHGIRRSCIDYSIPCITESDAAQAFLMALKRYRKKEKYFQVAPLPKPFSI